MRHMDVERLKALLEAVRAGTTDIGQALSELRDLPFRDLGFATVDHHRQLRTGVPEVILGEPKTAEQIAAIAEELARTGQNVLVTRLDAAKAALVQKQLGQLKYAPLARTGTLEVAPIRLRACGSVAVVTAGTADVPVAEEAAETLRMTGIEVLRVYDVGVAGIHRSARQESDDRSFGRRDRRGGDGRRVAERGRRFDAKARRSAYRLRLDTARTSVALRPCWPCYRAARRVSRS